VRKEIAVQFFIHNPEKITTYGKDHGRIETRVLQLMDVPEHLKKWIGVNQLLKMTRTRESKGKITTAVAYGITSLSKKDADLQRIMNLWRGHWHIENRLHWVRDMVFDEDRATIRKGGSPQIMAALRNLTIAMACKLNLSVTDMRSNFCRFHKRAIKLIARN
jgi:predicted transposase YbfD/YdcC